MSIRGIFKPIILVGSNINMFISRRVLIPLANITALLVITSNTYKYTFI
jgi:hypothetical protein